MRRTIRPVLWVVGALVALLVPGQALAGERTVRLAVENMDCAACPVIVKQSLARVQGVTKVEVSYGRKTASVTFDDAKATVAALIEATTKSGYPSRTQE
ncbi:MAG: mercury resistance system periplasmic binding protein MerP [Candidatus Rokuibacteriota bacterium]